MLLRLAALEGLEVEGLRRPAALSFDQRLSDGLKLKPPLLLAPDEVTDGLTVIVLTQVLVMCCKLQMVILICHLCLLH